MKENLRLILLIVGVIAIVALLIHGIWSSRKERSTLFGRVSGQKKRERQQRRDDYEELNDENLDVLQANIENIEQRTEAVDDFDRNTMISDSVFDENPIDATTEKGTDIVVHDAFDTEYVKDATSTDADRDDAINIQQENDKFEAKASVKEGAEKEESINEEPVNQVPQLMVVFHILGINDTPLRGDLLLKSFLNAGLHYGKMNIFHRHLTSPSTPVIFSVANMIKPGTFDPSHMMEFSTVGVTCFMVLPSVGQPLQNFKLMLQTVQRMADDVGGNVFDENRRLLTPQKIEEIRLSIRKWSEENPQNA